MLDPIQAAIVSIVTAAALFVLKELLPGALKWITGRADRERDRFRELEEDRQAAEVRANEEAKRADSEAAKRRRMEEFASALIRKHIAAGVPPDDPALHWPY